MLPSTAGCLLLFLTLDFGLGLAWAVEAQTTPAAPVHRVYARLMDPAEHPDYERRHVKPPSWDTFGNRTQFTSLRGFPVENDRIVRYVEEIDKYTREYDLGNVLWPSYPIVFANNLKDLVDEIKRRDLFLFDIWGYVPGSGPGGYWQQYRPPAEAFTLMESELGGHWLGMDVGEQDGRYIGGYASQMSGISGNRVEQYLNFQRHFERMGDELGNKLSTLVSLNFGHYLIKEGTYATIGAETAQALPNNQVYYAFIRGAGKQYGVPWFGNASVFNRWGYKAYGEPGADHSPTKGTSLNLLKRLMYSHILYNCILVGFESGWFDGDKLSPIGRVQQAANKWVQQYGQPGVMIAPVAVLLDFFSGWTFPRHLYTDHVYRVWGNIPYGPGDYLTDGVLGMLYPGYQDSSYFHDESGFLAPTPYGDIADCLLSDAPLWLLEHYPVVIVAGELSGGAEISDKLKDYVSKGGQLVITAGNLRKLPSAFPEVRVSATPNLVAANAPITTDEGTLQEEHEWRMLPIEVPAGARILVRCGESVIAAEAPVGEGVLTVLSTEFGVPQERPSQEAIRSEVDKPLATPYPLLKHVKYVIDKVLRRHVLFEAGEGLGLITCRKGPGEYTIGIFNNSLQQRPFKIVSHCGPIESVTEMPLDLSEKGAVGQLPEGFESAALGANSDGDIAGGDVRMFAVRINEQSVAEIPYNKPCVCSKGRILPIREITMIKEGILTRPTFFEHFDSVLVDWRYLHVREESALKEESGWLSRQGLRIYTDLTSGLNLYPDLRLLNNDEEEYRKSLRTIDGVLAKMTALGSHDLIVSLHRYPENNFLSEKCEPAFVSTLQEVCAIAAKRNIVVYLRTKAGVLDSIQAAARILGAVGAPNLRLAASTALLLDQKVSPDALGPEIKDKLGLWIVSAPGHDVKGNLWTDRKPIAGIPDAKVLRALLRVAPDVPMALDGVYASPDDEYLDVRKLQSLGET